MMQQSPSTLDSFLEMLAKAILPLGRSDPMLRTLERISNGYRFWSQGNTKNLLHQFPAFEFYQSADEDEPQDWPHVWADAGGRFFRGKGCSGGRMVALKNDPIWFAISAFGMPFAPFDLNSWMDIRDVDRGECIELGLLSAYQDIGPPLSIEGTAEAVAGKVHARIVQLEEQEQKCREDPVAYGTGDDVLSLAKDMLAEHAPLTSELAVNIETLLDKAIEKGCDDHGTLAVVYDAIGEREKATLHERQYIESANGFSLLYYAKRGLAALGTHFGRDEGARILDVLTGDCSKNAGIRFDAPCTSLPRHG